MIGRRRMLAAGLGAAVAALPNSVGSAGRHRVTQGELDDAIALHRLWLDDRDRGQRASFAFCNLAGLDFGSGLRNQVVLRNADFTGADLTDVTGNDVNFCHASLQYARLTGSHIKAPVFSNAILDGTDCRNVLWGWPARTAIAQDDVEPAEYAVFMNASLAGGVFDDARIRGYFYDTSLSGASFARADLSWSHLVGPEDGNRFGRARLIETRFRDTRISSARFKNALIMAADFRGARLAPRIAAHLMGRDAVDVALPSPMPQG